MEDVRLLAYLIFFLVAVIVFGLIYALLTPIGHGIGQNFTSLPDLCISDGIYFSIVTVSSLGYGDMHPMGISKALACLEVLMGLAVMGIMIAKMTSRRLSYHVLRLFSSDAQKRLEGIAAGFDKSRDEFAEIMPQLANAYQGTPGEARPHNRDQLVSELRNVVGVLRSRCVALSDYFSYENQQDSYFSIAPVSAVLRVGEAVDDALLRLGQLIISLSPQARTEVLDRRNRQGISDAIASQRHVCSLVHQHAEDPDIRSVFERIQETCEKVPESYFAIPEETQPDQVLQGTDEPQQPSGVENG